MSGHPHEILSITRDEDGALEVWQDGKTTGPPLLWRDA